MNMTRHTESVEVIFKDQRRRRWSLAEKSALVRRTYEPGMSQLGNLPATSDTVASLLYGTMINVYLYHALDMQELMSIGNFVSTHGTDIAYNPNSPYVAQLESMMLNALSTPAAPPIMSDAEIANVIGISVAGMAQAYGDDFALFDNILGGFYGV